jgi:hypothetical protein
MEVSCQLHSPAASPPGKESLVPIVGPRAGLDEVVKRKIPSTYRDSNPRSSSPEPSAIPLNYPGFSVRRLANKMNAKRTKYKEIHVFRMQGSIVI